MKSQGEAQELKNLKQLSLAIGQFIRYWGFRKVHGALWAQLYLAAKPLSGTELSKRLGLSKALVSPALGELVSWGLILPVDSGNEKTKLYTAEEDVNQVIRKVLRERELQIVGTVASRLASLKKASKGGSQLHQERIEKLEGMVHSAQLMLALLLQEENPLLLPERLGADSP